MSSKCCEFVDSRLRRSPPDRASAVPYGQARENAIRFPHLAHRSAAAHKLHSATATSWIKFESGKGETFSRRPALAYSSRNLSKRPGPPQVNPWPKVAKAPSRAAEPTAPTERPIVSRAKVAKQERDRIRAHRIEMAQPHIVEPIRLQNRTAASVDYADPADNNPN